MFLWDPRKSHRLLKQRRLKEQARGGTQPNAVPRTSRKQQQHPQQPERKTGVVPEEQWTPQPQPRREPKPQPRKNPPAPTTTTEPPPPTTTQPPRPTPRTKTCATDRNGVEELRNELRSLTLGPGGGTEDIDEIMWDVGTVGAVGDGGREGQEERKTPQICHKSDFANFCI